MLLSATSSRFTITQPFSFDLAAHHCCHGEHNPFQTDTCSRKTGSSIDAKSSSSGGRHIHPHELREPNPLRVNSPRFCHGCVGGRAGQGIRGSLPRLRALMTVEALQHQPVLRKYRLAVEGRQVVTAPSRPSRVHVGTSLQGVWSSDHSATCVADGRPSRRPNGKKRKALTLPLCRIPYGDIHQMTFSYSAFDCNNVSCSA